MHYGLGPGWFIRPIFLGLAWPILYHARGLVASCHIRPTLNEPDSSHARTNSARFPPLPESLDISLKWRTTFRTGKNKILLLADEEKMHYWVRASSSDFAGTLPQPRRQASLSFVCCILTFQIFYLNFFSLWILSGHTAVNIGKSKVIVFGGLLEKKFLSDIVVYDIGTSLHTVFLTFCFLIFIMFHCSSPRFVILIEIVLWVLGNSLLKLKSTVNVLEFLMLLFSTLVLNVLVIFNYLLLSVSICT